MNIALAEFQRRFPSTSCTVAGATWVFRDTDQDADRIPLVMLPGAGATGDVLFRAIEGLRDTRRIVSVSYPALDDADLLATGLLAALSEAGIERFDLFGSSLGGYLAQACALQAPERVRRCMFANTFYDAAWLRNKMSRDALRKTPADTHLANSIKQLQSAPEDTPEKADFKKTMLALVGPAQTAEMAKAVLLAVLGTKVLPKVSKPAETIAVLDADDDPVVDGPTRAAMRERYADSRQFRFATGGHYPALLNPAEFIAALQQHFGDQADAE
ncbi:alpha/beta fold hydrolase [Variovorax sp. KK3]|uniref:alpha/beta fold hydrolase n=1 Tax=Variovorax sp. KK3 TaxID=1855728 RepID=UPI00097C0661|nr:alpha/beta hydrolase [Variovorax sp. KK3]